jgi:hypothetical protein
VVADSAHLEADISYAEREWPVFPLKPRDKIPLIPKAKGGNGVHDATTDRDQIEAWWKRCPHANIGLACGGAFWVLDVDYRGFTFEHDGLDTLDFLTQKFGRLPRTLRAQTGSGGWHICFKPDSRVINSVKAMPGIDTRSTGGYIVADPSVHPNGCEYVWVEHPDEVPIAAAPEWLVALFMPLPEEREPVPKPVKAGDLDRYGRAALTNACERIHSAAPGYQCDTLDREAYGIGRLVAGGVIPRDTAEAEIVAAGCRMANQGGRRPWTRREVAWRVARAFAAASSNPRMVEGSL